VGIVLLAFLAEALVSPWAFHIGNRFTPLARWTGYGQALSSDAGTFAVRVNLGLNFPRGCQSCGNLSGTGEVCTSAATYRFTEIAGRMDAWWSSDGRPMHLGMGGTGAARAVGIHLTGTWKGADFVATDGGDLRHFIAPDGSLRSPPFPARTPGSALNLTLRPGTGVGFDALCRSLRSPSRAP
jgi:hypothetical protein